MKANAAGVKAKAAVKATSSMKAKAAVKPKAVVKAKVKAKATAGKAASIADRQSGPPSNLEERREKRRMFDHKKRVEHRALREREMFSGAIVYGCAKCREAYTGCFACRPAKL